jgi:hypothetical protein
MGSRLLEHPTRLKELLDEIYALGLEEIYCNEELNKVAYFDREIAEIIATVNIPAHDRTIKIEDGVIVEHLPEAKAGDVLYSLLADGLYDNAECEFKK